MKIELIGRNAVAHWISDENFYTEIHLTFFPFEAPGFLKSARFASLFAYISEFIAFKPTTFQMKISIRKFI